MTVNQCTKKGERGEKGGKEKKEEEGKGRKVYKVRHIQVNLYYGRKPDRHTRLSVHENDFCCCLFLKSEFPCVALAVLELALSTRWLQTQRST